MRNFLVYTAAILFAQIAIGNDDKRVLSGFSDSDKIELRPLHATVSKDAKSALIDTVQSGDWSVWLTTKAGVLKPNTNYKLAFTYRLEENSPINSRIHIVVRPLSKITGDADSFRNDETDLGVSKKVRISFKTNDYPDNSLQIHFGGKFKGSIEKLKLSEGSYEKFIPFTPDATPYEESLKNIPTGAKEFDVDQPRPTKEIVVNAADFGLKEGTKNVLDIINKAIEHCKKIGASKLIINKGSYYIDQNGSISLKDFSDFTFDGGGSTFTYYKKSGTNFIVENCLRTKIRNFNMDWDWSKDPIASIVEVVNKGADKQGDYVDIKFLGYDKFPKKDVRLVIMTPYDPVAKSVGMEGRSEPNFGNNDGRNNPPTKWLTPNTLRVWRINKNMFEKSWQFRLVHYSYDMGCFRFMSNKHFTAEDINIFSSPGCGINIGGTQQFWQFKNFNMQIPNDGNPHRCVTTSADHCHIINSLGFFKMENCDFGYGCDDSINMHDCSVFARKISECTLAGARMGRHLKVGDTVEFRHGDYSPANFEAKIVDIKLTDTKTDTWETTFDKKVPDNKIDGFVLFNRAYSTRNIIIRNCYFHHNRARGLLILASDVTVEKNRFFRNEQAGIKIETGYTYKLWCEGFGANNIKITDNIFDTVNPRGMTNRTYERDIFIGSYQKTDPTNEHTTYPILSNILIENNTFKDTFGLCAYIASAGNVVIRNNTFEAATERLQAREYRGGFYVRNSSDIKILNNKYKSSKLFRNLGVSYDSTNSKRILAAGNKTDM